MASEDVTCENGNVLDRVGCIFSYGGSVPDAIINYLTILVNLAFCIKIVSSTYAHDKEAHTRHRTYALSSLIFVVVFQVVLCLAVGCSGVSIIWCAMGGWVMSERRRVVKLTDSVHGGAHGEESRLADRLIYYGKVVICIDTIVIIYYMVVAPAITTVAHLCALVLGAVLSEISLRILEKTSGTALEGTPEQHLLST